MAHLANGDTVVDIGAGRGIITAELARVAGRVIAVEIDPDLVSQLKRQFAAVPGVEVRLADIRQFELPGTLYKVFANIPFHITTDIINKLLYYSTPPVEAYLVLPIEAAEKFSGLRHETQFSVLAKPWFEFKILRNLSKADFSPSPEVETCLLEIVKREAALVAPGEEMMYRSFIKYAFSMWKKDLKVGLKRIFTYNQWKRLAGDNGFGVHAKPTDLTFNQWLAIFRFFMIGVGPGRQTEVLL
jgi:23S rRNA (adenine-N6)-dimethyltransferase